MPFLFFLVCLKLFLYKQFFFQIPVLNSACFYFLNDYQYFPNFSQVLAIEMFLIKS